MTNAAPNELEDVLDLFVLETETPDREQLLSFIARFPQYRRELIDFAAQWIEQDLLPPPSPPSEAAEARLDNHMRSFVQNQLFALKAMRPVEASPASGRMTANLAKLATRSGRSLHDVAAASGLDLSLMRKLNSRLIRPETIPQRVTRQIADFLGASVSEIQKLWAGPPRIGSASYRSDHKPRMVEQEDFADAVASSSLSPEKRAELLASD